MQGQTVKAGSKVVIHWHKKFTCGMAYVMLGRSERLQDIFIDGDFKEEKIKCNPKAMEASVALLERALNNPVNASPWFLSSKPGNLRISLLNIRSLQAHFDDLKMDSVLLKSDLICLCETWIHPDMPLPDLKLPGFNLHHCSVGRGKGVAVFIKETIQHEEVFLENSLSYQSVGIQTQGMKVVTGYRSQECNLTLFKQSLLNQVCLNGKILILGDFNIDINSPMYGQAFKEFEESGFKQMIDYPTHEAGHILDLAFINFPSSNCQWFHHQPYYSDHDALCVLLNCGNE
jgi:hypothetical protein